jgi:hypothetical protein
MKALVPAILLCLLAACNSDKGPEVCVPKSLRAYNDSIYYQYNDKHELTALLNFSGVNTMHSRIDLAYNNGKLVTVTNTITWSVTPRAVNSYTLEYGSDGMPSRLTEISPPEALFKTITEFTHDNNKRLVKAISSVTGAGYPTKSHVGGYVYEYNDAGNVTTVKYVIIDPQNTSNTKEVLGRENLTFDDRPPFYAGSKELTTLNVYVYKYIPNANNSIKARIYYVSNHSSLSSPSDITFTVNYDQNGRIATKSTPFFQSLSGELFFTKATYECF